MTDTTLLSDTLRDWSDEVAVPHDLADRALAGHRTTRRRRALPVLAGLATATAVVVAFAAAGTWGPLGDVTRDTIPALQDDLEISADTAHNPPEELVAAGAVAVSAVVRYDRVPVAGLPGWETLQRSYDVLDPGSGRYLPTDWSYVAVAPGLEQAAVLEGSLPISRVGILDLRTGDVRWVETAKPVAALAWSPDGSTVVATAYDGDPDLQKSDGANSFQLADARRTGFVLVDVADGSAEFHAARSTDFGRRTDLGFTSDGRGVWTPSGTPGQQFYDLDGYSAAGDPEQYNSNLSVDAALFPLTSPDGRFTITRQSGLPTAITDTRTGEVHRQQALQVLGWADDEHVVTLAGCSDPCVGRSEFRNGLVVMRYDGSGAVRLTGPRNGVNDWSFELTPR